MKTAIDEIIEFLEGEIKILTEKQEADIKGKFFLEADYKERAILNAKRELRLVKEAKNKYAPRLSFYKALVKRRMERNYGDHNFHLLGRHLEKINYLENKVAYFQKDSQVLFDLVEALLERGRGKIIFHLVKQSSQFFEISIKNNDLRVALFGYQSRTASGKNTLVRYELEEGDGFCFLTIKNFSMQKFFKVEQTIARIIYEEIGILEIDQPSNIEILEE